MGYNIREITSVLEALLPCSDSTRILSSGLKVIKLFSCSNQLSMKFQLLIKTKIATNKQVSCFKSLRCCIFIMLINVKMPMIVGILPFMGRINFVLI